MLLPEDEVCVRSPLVVSVFAMPCASCKQKVNKKYSEMMLYRVLLSPKSNSKMGRTEVTYKAEGCYMHGGHITRTMMPTLKTTASKQWPNQ